MNDIVWNGFEEPEYITKRINPKFLIRILDREVDVGHLVMANSFSIQNDIFTAVDLYDGVEKRFYIEDVDHIIIRVRENGSNLA